MTPFGGPYCRTGRWVIGGGGGGFGSLTAYMVASKLCGSTIMVTFPSFTMLSFGGLFGSSMICPLFLTGLDQYFGNMASDIHCCRDRVRDSERTPLERICQHFALPQHDKPRERTFLSPTDNPYLRDRLVVASQRLARACQH